MSSETPSLPWITDSPRPIAYSTTPLLHALFQVAPSACWPAAKSCSRMRWPLYLRRWSTCRNRGNHLRHRQRHQGCGYNRCGHATPSARADRLGDAPGRAASRLRSGPRPRRSGAPCQAAPSAGTQFGIARLRRIFRTADTPSALLRACLELRLECEPGARFEYSDPGFILLGKALEVLTREPCPPGPRTTSFSPSECLPPVSARRKAPSRSFHPPRRTLPSATAAFRAKSRMKTHGCSRAAGHAGLFSNIPDLLRFAGKSWKPRPSTGDARLLDAAAVEFFARRQGPEGSSRALGWDTPSANSSSGRHFSPHSIGHLGFSGCSLWIDLDAAIASSCSPTALGPTVRSQVIRAVRPAFHNAVREAL